MSEPASNPWPLRALLASIAAAVWATVAWQYMRVTSASDAQDIVELAPRSVSTDIRVSETFVPPPRDPFLPLVTATLPGSPSDSAQAMHPGPSSNASRTDAPRVRQPSAQTTYDDFFGRTTPPLVEAPVSVEPPDIIFRGVVGERALLEGSDGQTALLREGDHIGGSVLSRISTEFVTVSKGGETFIVFPE